MDARCTVFWLNRRRCGRLGAGLGYSWAYACGKAADDGINGGISLSAAGRHTRLAPGHAGTGKAGTPFWRRTDRHNAPRKAPLWSALSSLLLLWLGVGGTVFAVITGFDLPVGRGAVALSCAAVPAVVWFLALPLRAARLLHLPALLLGAALLASAGENALRGAVLTAQNITQAYHAYFPAVPVWFRMPMTLENRS
ncbi:MAG: hypothetical protein ACLR7U_02595 [Ruthenibacterium lactatiformans]